MCLGQALNLFEIDAVILTAHAILDGVEPLSRLVGRGTMGQVATGIEAHAEDRIARLQNRLEHTLVRLAAGIRLHIGEPAIEKLLGAVNCEVLCDVDKLAAAIVAAPRVAFGVFVGEDGPLRFKHGFGNNVFRNASLCCRL